jgi:hypothetical protein
MTAGRLGAIDKLEPLFPKPKTESTASRGASTA